MAGLTQRLQHYFSTGRTIQRQPQDHDRWDELLASCAELLNLTSSLGIHVEMPTRSVHTGEEVVAKDSTIKSSRCPMANDRTPVN